MNEPKFWVSYPHARRAVDTVHRLSCRFAYNTHGREQMLTGIEEAAVNCAHCKGRDLYPGAPLECYIARFRWTVDQPAPWVSFETKTAMENWMRDIRDALGKDTLFDYSWPTHWSPEALLDVARNHHKRSA